MKKKNLKLDCSFNSSALGSVHKGGCSIDSFLEVLLQFSRSFIWEKNQRCELDVSIAIRDILKQSEPPWRLEESNDNWF